MGRPLSFNPDDALAQIKDTFWRLGYEGASLQEIEAATGLKKQSLYRLFGDKRAMYLKALAQYEAEEVTAGLALLAAPGSPREKIGRLLDAVVDATVAGGDRRGCFLCNASVDQAQLDEETQKAVMSSITRLRAGFEAALEAGAPFATDAALRRSTAVQVLAAYFGLRVLIKAGAPETVLRDAVGATLRLVESPCLPSNGAALN